MTKQLTHLPNDSKPRELLVALGEKALSNRDLLAIILRTGTKEESVIELANRILLTHDNLYTLKALSLDELCRIKGIGKIRAIELKAMMELGQRIQQANQMKLGTIVSSQSAGEYLMREMKDLLQENVVALYLNTKNQVLKKQTIFIGTSNHSIAEPRDIFREALKTGAVKMIIAHNHPSGNPEPSGEDIAFTKKLVSGGELLGVQVLDHIIIGQTHYVSLKEQMLF